MKKTSRSLFTCLCLSIAFLLLRCSTDYSSAYSTDEAVIAKGQKVFELSCSACHNFRATSIGPNLTGITQEVSPDWLKNFIHDSKQVIDSGDERAVHLFETYKQYMPAFNLNEDDMEAVLAYINTFQKEAGAVTETDEAAVPAVDYIPEKIPLSNIKLTLQEIAQAPPTAETSPLARINKMLPMPGKAKRLFIHDLRGILYELKDGTLEPFLKIADHKPYFINQPGLATGLGSFAFHPEYEKNGLFYTTHTEDPATSPPADFTYPDTINTTVRWVLTEWKQQDPKAATFSGTSRELWRIDMVTGIHGVQEVIFNPLAKPGDKDYGMLYIGVGDGGSAEQGYLFLTQNKSLPWGSILRINPAGKNSENGKYGIPADNPYASDNDPNTLGEIWAHGFRNPHRITWDTQGNGNMLASDIGQHSMEELNIILPGHNYGWPEREGTFVTNKPGDLHIVHPLPEDDAKYNYTYPVVQFDHDEATAISSGYVYYGSALPELKGKYIFGGIVDGRVFFVNAADLKLGQQAPIQEISLQLEDGQATTLQQLTQNTRVDLRFGLDADGELYIFTKADGKIYKVVRSVIQ